MKCTTNILLFIIITISSETNAQYVLHAPVKKNTKKEGSKEKYNFLYKYIGQDTADATTFSSLDEYYQQTAKSYDSIANVLHQRIMADYQNNYSDILKDLVSSDIGLSDFKVTERIADLDNNLEEELKAVRAIQNIAAGLKFKARTENKLVFLPVKNAADASMFYFINDKGKRSHYFKNTRFSLSPSEDSYALYSEVYSDYFSVVRFGVGTVIGAASQSTDEIDTAEGYRQIATNNAINRLTSGGGNVVINLGFPLLCYENRNNNFMCATFINPRIGFDLPILGSTTGQYPINVETALTTSFYYGGFLEQIAIVGDIKLSTVFGNDTFYSGIGTITNDPFAFHQLSLGLMLSDKFQIKWNKYFGNKFITQLFPQSISFSLSIQK